MIAILVLDAPDRGRAAGRAAADRPASAWCCRRPASGLAVFGVLRSSVWGWVTPKPDAPELFGRLADAVADPRRRCSCCGCSSSGSRGSRRAAPSRSCARRCCATRSSPAGCGCSSSSTSSSRACSSSCRCSCRSSLGLSAIDTGVRLLPLSVTLLIAAAGIPRFRPTPIRAASCGSGCSRCSPGPSCCSRPSTRTPRPRSSRVPLLLLGLGIGALASQLGSRHRVGRARRAKPRGRRPAEHGDEPRRVARHRAGRLGADRQPDRDPAGRHRAEPRRRRRGQAEANVELAGRRPVPVRRRLEAALDDGRRHRQTAAAIVDENAKARLARAADRARRDRARRALALLFSGGIPTRQPGSARGEERAPPVAA